MLAFFFGGFYRNFGGGFVVHPLAVAPVAVGVNQHATAGVGGAQTASLSAKSAEHDGVHDAQARAGKHGDGQLGDHRQVNRHAVAGFQACEIAQQRSGFVHALVELLIGDDRIGFAFGLWNKNDGGFVFIFGEMPVDAVVAGVQLSAHEPFPERRIARVQRFAPGFVPIQQGSVVIEATREMLFAELFDESGVFEFGLRDKLFGRPIVLLFLPVHGNLRFTEFLAALHFQVFCAEFLTRCCHGGSLEKQ